MQRSYKQEIKKRLNEPLRRIQVIAGPRQVGKTTLIRTVIREMDQPVFYHTADAISVGHTVWLEQVWNTARLSTGKGKKGVVLVIDEIQKVYQWSETVKRLWDEDRANGKIVRVVLLGSSRLLLQQGLSESLAGRFEMISIPHWRYSEMKKAFGFTHEQYAWFGSYPGSADLIANESRWSDYIRDSLIESAINRDVLMLSRIDKPALLKRLFEVGTFYSGQVISYTKIIGQLQDAGNTTTLAHYIELLEGAGLLMGLKKFSPDIARKRGASPKFQTFNPALKNCRGLRKFNEAKKDPAYWGRIIESAIGAHLLTFLNEGLEVSYWQQGDAEVDFILQYNGKTIALEVKSGQQNFTSLDKFKRQFPEIPVFCIGERFIDWKEFLETDPRSLFGI